MDHNQTVLIHSFTNRYSCIGGDCPLTCCNAKRWGIALNDKEIERFNALDEPFRTHVMNCINTEKKRFKTREEVYGDTGTLGEMCAMLTEDGWCELVLNCGEDVLSNVCHLYPRTMVRVNDYFEHHVSLSCPVVAKFLFDEVPIENQIIDDMGYIGSTEEIDRDVADTIREVKAFISELFLSIDGYSAGKFYIFFEIVHLIEKLMKENVFGPESVSHILSKYMDDEIFSSILTSCEEIKADVEKRGTMAAIGIERSSSIMSQLNETCHGRLEKLDEHVSEWKNGINIAKDLNEFYKYRDENWPKFLDRLMSYRVFSGWMQTEINKLAMFQKGEYYLTFLEEIAAMSYWKAHGNKITVDEFVYIICCLERSITHSPTARDMLYKSVDEFEKGMNFNMFLLPVY